MLFRKKKSFNLNNDQSGCTKGYKPKEEKIYPGDEDIDQKVVTTPRKSWINKNWKWILIAIIAYITIYLIIPKYYFKIDIVDNYKIKQVISTTCNKITGHCKIDIIYNKEK